MPRTLFEKIWDDHAVIRAQDGGGGGGERAPSLLYVDRHLVHEVTSPQAFDGLRAAGRRVRRTDLTVATVDHNVPTTDRSLPMADRTSEAQIRALERNCSEFGVRLFGVGSPDQGIVHVIGPQLGMTLPGTTIVCGDSHTSTHGAFGALAFGIGTSEVEHVLASQTLWMTRPESFEIRIKGRRRNPVAVTAKDVILSVIRNIGTAGGAGTVVEYRGEGIEEMSMEQRMTVCNMSIEGGARAGLIAPDEKTYEYLRGRRFTPDNYDELVEAWREELHTDAGARFDRSYTLDAAGVAPQVSWGTNPAMTCDVTERVPHPDDVCGEGDGGRGGPEAPGRDDVEKALRYMDLRPGTPVTDIEVDRVFIGSCTNARIEDLRDAARVVGAAGGKTVSPRVEAMVVPGSQAVKRQAEEEGLDGVFRGAGFEWRESGCSMCLGMNPDILKPGQRCASTSNRNFEGRQGAGGRTHLVSPVMAAAAAIAGRFVDVRELDLGR